MMIKPELIQRIEAGGHFIPTEIGDFIGLNLPHEEEMPRDLRTSDPQTEYLKIHTNALGRYHALVAFHKLDDKQPLDSRASKAGKDLATLAIEFDNATSQLIYYAAVENGAMP